MLAKPVYRLLLMPIAILTGCVTPDSNLPQAFDRAVFGADADRRTLEPRLVRWQGPVRYAVKGVVSDAQRAVLAQAIADASSATGLTFVRAGGSSAELVLFFGDARGFLSHVRTRDSEPNPGRQAAVSGGFCWTTSWIRGDVFFESAIFVAPARGDGGGGEAERADGGQSCLGHELAHALGLLHHPNDVFTSLRGHGAGFTSMDRRMLGILYDRRLSVGMPRSEVLDRLPGIDADHRHAR